MKTYQILCGKDIHSGFREALNQSEYSFDIHVGDVPDKASVDILVTMLSKTVDEAFLAPYTNVKLVLNYAVGFNNIDLDYCRSRQILVGNTPGVLTEATAHHALLLMLAASRNLQPSLENIARNEWKDWEPLGFLGPDVRGKTLGIYGMGRIGFYFARLCRQAFDMDIIYHNRNEHPEAAGISARLVSFADLATESDFLSLHAPLVPDNRYIFDHSFFRKMKPEAVFINTSRGGLVNHDDLYHALVDKRIFAAALDVTEPEPVSNDFPLLGLDNCIITPHIASATYEARKAMARCVSDNILDYLEQGRLRYPV